MSCSCTCHQSNNGSICCSCTCDYERFSKNTLQTKGTGGNHD